MTELEQIQEIAVKYHKHLDGTEPEEMVYFTMEDCWAAMKDYHQHAKREELEEWTDEKIKEWVFEIKWPNADSCFGRHDERIEGVKAMRDKLKGLSK